MTPWRTYDDWKTDDRFGADDEPDDEATECEPMTDEKTIIHVAKSEKRPGLPDCGLDRCPKCGGDLEDGFGLAGGGFGVYQYCGACEEIVSKTIVED